MDTEWFEKFRKIERCGFAFNGRVQGKHNLSDFQWFMQGEPGKQFTNLDIIRSYTIQRRNDAMKHMVKPFVVTGFLEGEHIDG